MSSSALAAGLPTGGAVAHGEATVSQSGSTLTVVQTTPQLITNWTSFNIAPGSTVNFLQPSSTSVALNRVTGSDPSTISGALNANGRLFLLNPNGVLFGKGAQVNVGGLTASTLNLSDSDFLSGNYHFTGESQALVGNAGSIRTHGGGTVALIAAHIQNTGQIQADGGAVLLGAGSDVLLDLGGPASIQVKAGALNALIQNGGAIRADGGTILLTAQAAGSLMSTVINNTGLIEAQTLVSGEKGDIKLLGGMQGDQIAVGGRLDASAPNGGDGGNVETSAASVVNSPDLVVTAGAPHGAGGSWLVDPYNYTINSTAAGNIATALNSGTNVTITTQSSVANYGGGASGSGDIVVSSPIAKTAGGAASLTLQADRNITVSSAITSTSNALNLTLSAGNAASATNGGVNVGADLTTNGGILLIGGAAGTSSNGISYALNFDASTPAVAIQQNVAISSGGGQITINGKSNLSSSSYDGTKGGVYVLSGASINSGGGNLFMGGISTGAAKEFGFAVEANSGTLTSFTTGTGSGNIVVDAQNTVSANGALGLVNNGNQNRVQFSAPSVAALMVEINGSPQATTFTMSPPCGSAYPNCGTMLIPGSNSSYLYADYQAVSMATHALYVFTGSGSKTYDGTTTASGLTLTTLGAPGDFSTGGLTFSTSSKAAGSYYTLNPGAADPTTFNSTSTGLAYAVAYFNGVYTIGQKALTVTVSNKVYDGTTAAALSSSGVVSGDNLTFTATGGFSDANVGTGKTVTATGISLGGTDAGNYSLSGTSVSTTANITARPVSLTGNRVYDGSATVAAGVIALGNLVSGEALTLTGSGTMADKAAGSNKTLGLGTLALGNGTGGLASNYTLVGGTDLVTISKANLTVSGLWAQDKVYDGTTTATLTGSGTVSGALGSDDVSLIGSSTGTFADKNVGTGKTVTASASGFTLAGADAGNYQITGFASPLTASITKANLTVSGLSAQDRVYNSGTSATITGTAGLSGVIGSDTVTVSGSVTGSFADKTAGAAKTVTVDLSGLSLGGGDADNYQIGGLTAPLTASISKLGLTLFGLSAQDKTYDGTSSATVSGNIQIGGIQGSDNIYLTGAVTGAFATKTAASNKTVNADLSGLAIGGNDAGNYEIGGIFGGLTATISKANLTVSGLTAQDKVYDGGTGATLAGNAALGGVIGSDQVTVSGAATGAFLTKDAGTGKSVTANLSGLSLGGGDAGNYQISGLAGGLTASITKATLTVSGLSAQDKVYDRTTQATLTGLASLSGLIGSDQVTLSGGATGAFADKDAGSGKAVNVNLTGLSLGGADISNYQIGGLANALNASITKAGLTISGLAGKNKVYDGTTLATLTGTARLGGVIGPDQVALSGAVTGAFADKNAGTGKAINANLSGVSLAGGDAGNYRIVGLTGGLSAEIARASLTIGGLAGQNKVYDGTTAATLGGTAGLRGVIGSDQVSLTGALTGAFQNPDVGTGKTIVASLGVSLSGPDAGNYRIAGLGAPLTADITAAPATTPPVTEPPVTTPPPADPPAATPVASPPAVDPPVTTPGVAPAPTPPAFAYQTVTQPSLPRPVSSPVTVTAAPTPTVSTAGGLNYVFVSNTPTVSATAISVTTATTTTTVTTGGAANSPSSTTTRPVSSVGDGASATGRSGGSNVTSSDSGGSDSSSSSSSGGGSSSNQKGGSAAIASQNTLGPTDVLVVNGGINASVAELGVAP